MIASISTKLKTFTGGHKFKVLFVKMRKFFIDISKIVHGVPFTKKIRKEKITKRSTKKKRENWVFKRRTDRPPLLHLAEAGALETPPPVRQLEHSGKEGSLEEAVGACLQTPATNTKPSILARRLHCIRRGAD